MINLRLLSALGKTVLSLAVVAVAIWLVQTARELDELTRENMELNMQIVRLGDVNKRLNIQMLTTTIQLQKVQEQERIAGEKSNELQKQLRSAQKDNPGTDPQQYPP
ncbi:DUF2570 domain-containing protein [Yersinia rochesterensis]|uniref:DUF2570 domain-containing protein n=1 Tax=Yersinia rochesterensis TaxID=1604335 RepID=UPI001643A0C8|nr:DUF2570 domain-containing protein [Yersinia rochesterensis]MDR5017957.1 DUF2570 domain-containing protein [Yersinia rochesterensis]